MLTFLCPRPKTFDLDVQDKWYLLIVIDSDEEAMKLPSNLSKTMDKEKECTRFQRSLCPQNVKMHEFIYLKQMKIQNWIKYNKKPIW